jgi:hypothetical protein
MFRLMNTLPVQCSQMKYEEKNVQLCVPCHDRND